MIVVEVVFVISVDVMLVEGARQLINCRIVVVVVVVIVIVVIRIIIIGRVVPPSLVSVVAVAVASLVCRQMICVMIVVIMTIVVIVIRTLIDARNYTIVGGEDEWQGFFLVVMVVVVVIVKQGYAIGVHDDWLDVASSSGRKKKYLQSRWGVGLFFAAGDVQKSLGKK